MCVQVLLNRLRFDDVISTTQTIANGKDLSSFLINGSPAIGAGGDVATDLADYKTKYLAYLKTLQVLGPAITDLKKLLASVDASIQHNTEPNTTRAAEALLLNAKNNYTPALSDTLANIDFYVSSIYPTDLPAGVCTAGVSAAQPFPGTIAAKMAATLKTQSDTLAAAQKILTAAQDKITADDTTAGTLADADKKAVDVAQEKVKGLQGVALTSGKEALQAAQKKLDADVAAAKVTHDKEQGALDVAQAKVDAINAVGAELSTYAAWSDTYKCNAPSMVSVSKELATLSTWKTRLLASRFIKSNGTLDDNAPASLFLDARLITCGGLFNQTATNVLTISTIDQAPTLDFAAAGAATAATTFTTITCSSPISVSAGLEISGIPNQEFAVIQSKDSSGMPVPKFAYNSTSPVHLLPIGVAHARLWESPGMRFAAHASVGVSGNLQGSASGGSTAEYLIGPSISLFRTIYFTTGVHIGYKSVLNGGYSIGDTAPASITTPSVYKSVTARYGFAITFTKP